VLKPKGINLHPRAIAQRAGAFQHSFKPLPMLRQRVKIRTHH
jgi:hypothetical protein